MGIRVILLVWPTALAQIAKPMELTKSGKLVWIFFYFFTVVSICNRGGSRISGKRFLMYKGQGSLC